jgi:phosphohistidine phosphatase
MNVYLVRHGSAMDKEENPERPLTEEGARQVDELGAFLAARWVFDEPLIWHSGKPRAEQTAVRLGSHVAPGVKPEHHAGLTPNARPEQTARDLETARKDVMIAGHLPHLGRLAGLLLTGDADQEMIAFEKAGVVCLTRKGGELWQLCWMVTPVLVSGQR